MPIFGNKAAGAQYKIRCGAYAVILDDAMRVAVIYTPGGYFLPGGGIEEGETSEQALHREVMEECGMTLRILQPIGSATDHLYAPPENCYYEKRGSFYLGQFIEANADGDAPPFVWLETDTRAPDQPFRQEGHAWAATRGIQIASAELIVTLALSMYQKLGRPIIVAIDGGSGSGKSSYSVLLQDHAAVVGIPLDDFYTTQIAEHEWPEIELPRRLELVFDWQRIRRDVLIPLRSGMPGRWQPFDFTAGIGHDGKYALQKEFKVSGPAPIIVLEGAYSASAALSDLVDLAVLVNVPEAERHRRKLKRDGQAFADKWHAIWDPLEEYYFGRMRPASSFDLVVKNPTFRFR
ncbi:MAG: NUDIX domain-containing protein [Candidatus Methylacidiphilales bacterium]|nr:NUDIX domain-containing protein [Candidatus Methylacidiphilales bacterium]